jgi:hypothetical protein
MAEKRKPKNLDVGRVQSTIPLLREMEAMVALIPRVFEGSLSLEAFQAPGLAPDEERWSMFGCLLPDAFVNPQYLHFAMSGCLAGSVCYLLYGALAWLGLSSSVTTCVLTALSTMGRHDRSRCCGSPAQCWGDLCLDGRADLCAAVCRYDRGLFAHVFRSDNGCGVDRDDEPTPIVLRAADWAGVLPGACERLHNLDVADDRAGPRAGHASGKLDDVAGFRTPSFEAGSGGNDRNLRGESSTAGRAGECVDERGRSENSGGDSEAAGHHLCKLCRCECAGRCSSIRAGEARSQHMAARDHVRRRCRRFICYKWRCCRREPSGRQG